MKKLSSYLMPLALGLTLLGCSKDDPEPSKTDLLIGKDWIINAATIDPGLPNPSGGGAITDFYSSIYFPGCAKDDFIRFDKPNAFKTDQGANRCPGAVQNTSGTWTFNSTETVLTTTEGTDNTSYDVIELTDNRMVLSETGDVFGNGVNYKLTATYVRK